MKTNKGYLVTTKDKSQEKHSVRLKIAMSTTILPKLSKEIILSPTIRDSSSRLSSISAVQASIVDQN